MTNAFDNPPGANKVISFPNIDGVAAHDDEKWLAVPGPYPGVLIEAEEGQSEAGHKKITLKFEVDCNKGYPLNMYLNCSMHTPGTLARMVRTMAALGVPSGASIPLDDLLGRRCTCNVVDDNYKLPKKQSTIESIEVIVETAPDDQVPF